MVDIKETLRLHAMRRNEEGGVRANLYEANLCGANLHATNLHAANLGSVRGNGHEIKSMQIGRYDVVYTAEMLQIGCQRKLVAEWFELDSVPGYLDLDDEWAAFKPLIKQIIEQYPATATGKENQNG